MAIEYAGFEIIDQIDHLFSQGASKSKSARRMLAMQECELPGRHCESSLPPEAERQEGDHVCADHVEPTEWDGHGTGLAPSHESWYLVRKPLEGTIAENLKKWGTGVIDIDGARITGPGGGIGRWPKNVVLSHGPGCMKRGTAFVLANPTWDTPGRDTAPALFTGREVSKVRHVSTREGEPSAKRRYTGRGSASMAKTPGERRDEVEEVDVWECEPGCAALALALAEQGGKTKSGMMRAGTMPDAGAVTRFFLQLRPDPFVPYRYESKPARAEKDAGLRYFRRRSGARNMHATVKSEKWMRYAVKLICAPRGVVLDPFAGSGSTGVGAILESRRFIGFDIHNSDDEPHVEIARARITYADGGGELVPRKSLQEPDAAHAMFGDK
jgi:site-specific DNA-methyltransferase (adenine-specific)